MLSENDVAKYFNCAIYHGELSGTKNIFVAQAGQQQQGLVIRFYLQIERDQVINAKFKVYGDQYAMAACHWFLAMNMNKNINEIDFSINNLLKLMSVPNNKLIAVTLAEAFQLSLSKYYNLRESEDV